MNLKDYYTIEVCELIFKSVDRAKWRIWKVIDEDRQCYQNKYQISTPEKLRKFVHQCRNPVALYVSVSTFLSPQSNHGFFAKQMTKLKNGYYFYPRAGYIFADCIMLDSDFFIDADSEEDLTIAQEDGRKIINHMKAKEGFRLKEIQFSGTKGIHLTFKRTQHIEIPNPINRIKFYQEQNEQLVNELLELGLKTIDKHHKEIIKNPFCVHAAPYSVKASKNIVQPIKLEDFMNNDIYDILSLKPTRAKRKELAIEASANDHNVAISGEKSPQPKSMRMGRGRDSLSTFPHYYMCVANFVPGLWNNYVPFIKIHKSKHINLKKSIDDLGDILIFEEKNYYWIIGYKLFQKSKLLKIMRRLKASNCSEFQRRYAKFRFSNMLDKKRHSIEDSPLLIKKIKSNKRYSYSLPHRNFFEEFDAQEQMYGRPKLKTYEVTMGI